MASQQQSEQPPRSATPRQDPEDDDIVDIGRGESNSEEPPRQPDTQQQDVHGCAKSPAYVGPIPEIGSIPPIPSGIQISTADRPNIPPYVGSLLVGKPVDEDGDIVDEKTGQLLARAGGDLPSIVGRRVSNIQGDILGDNGELLGYVADVEVGRSSAASLLSPSAGQPRPRSLFDLMGRATSSLMVDHLGNILDRDGNVVGRFHDNNNPLHRKKEEREARERMRQEEEKPEEEQQQQQEQQQPPPPTPQQPQSTDDSQPRPRRTEEERRQNAEAWRKENPNESPSDIFLDVKSTREGIQLTIRIPTVFNGQQATPHISFS
ncbi:hypothetical protein VTK56DRAFT_800 [Thermocarpiscus australiensis]